MLSRIKRSLRDMLVDQGQVQVDGLRVAPLQEVDADNWLDVPMPDFEGDAIAYAISPWLATAINRMAEIAMLAAPQVRRLDDQVSEVRNHPLLDLIGMHGQPNDYQDSLEFREVHFQQLDMFGNSFWYWSSRNGGAPDEVFLLDPQRVRIRPGRDRTIDHYVYWHGGRNIKIDPVEVTQFRKGNPYVGQGYYGLPGTRPLRPDIQTDHKMILWNRAVFETGAPSGILVVPNHLSDEQVRKMASDLEMTHKERRRVAVVRAEQGSAVWYEAMLSQRDMDFREGRLLTRQAIYDMVGFHVGLTSEASTEAHARVAERTVRWNVYTRLVRTQSRLTTRQVLGFWPGASRVMVAFEDIRTVDWEQEALKLKAILPVLTVDEIRQREFGLGPRKVKESGNGTNESGNAGSNGVSRTSAKDV